MDVKHGVQIESGYKNDHACAYFVNFYCSVSAGTLKGIEFFSIQSDASTDAANKECELFMVQYLDCKATDGQLHIRDRFFLL